MDAETLTFQDPFNFIVGNENTVSYPQFLPNMAGGVPFACS
jgi:hypothetical protein